MFVFKLFPDYAKEEKWLNEMAKKGFSLEKVTLGYHFRAAEPEDACIRIDFRYFKDPAEYINYCTMFEDSGWKHIAGSQHTGVQYFKRMPEAQNDDIFSDFESRAQRYIRAFRIWVYFALFVLFFMVVLLSTGSVDFRALIDPRFFYLTPGLWEKTGPSFWKAFWFETPFAMFRAGLLYFYPVSILIYLFIAAKARFLYGRAKKEPAE
ncbi:MAG: DUF2812 domain-containing protein [Chloroflexi bacterium]|jgi:hypothetical protein|nr:DUF2812 domain-containing protein [Chloroflexota bacterium]BCY17155.1 hypothetical protein hrd7_10040 [Leptolinea sp. HRD-7]